jgi:hypothetical protein
MPSASTLKYEITVQRSLYAALCVFFLYGFVIVLLLLVCRISWLTFPLYMFLLTVAVYGAGRNYQQRYYLKLSDCGLVELKTSTDGSSASGVISASSFYNNLFIFLHLKSNPNDFATINESRKVTVVIYRDAVSESEYRLLARLINFRRD